MKISANPNDTIIARYAFFRAEQILGLSSDDADLANSAFGIKHAHIFTFGGIYLNDSSLVKALLSADTTVQRSAGLIFATLLNVYEGSADRLKEWIVSKLVSSTDGVWELAIPALTTFTRNNNARKAALVEAGVVQNIASIFRTIDLSGKTQQVYELCFVLWTLCLGQLDLTAYLASGIVPILVDLLASAPTRKIVRMTLATLRNLTASEDDNMLNEMYTAHLPKVLDTMSHNHFLRNAADEEAEQDFKFLQDVLSRNFRELSSYERWTSQVYSGSLR